MAYVASESFLVSQLAKALVPGRHSVIAIVIIVTDFLQFYEHDQHHQNDSLLCRSLQWSLVNADESPWSEIGQIAGQHP